VVSSTLLSHYWHCWVNFSNFERLSFLENIIKPNPNIGELYCQRSWGPSIINYCRLPKEFHWHGQVNFKFEFLSEFEVMCENIEGVNLWSRGMLNEKNGSKNFIRLFLKLMLSFLWSFYSLLYTHISIFLHLSFSFQLTVSLSLLFLSLLCFQSLFSQIPPFSFKLVLCSHSNFFFDWHYSLLGSFWYQVLFGMGIALCILYGPRDLIHSIVHRCILYMCICKGQYIVYVYSYMCIM
jgi:hypothetical protein